MTKQTYKSATPEQHAAHSKNGQGIDMGAAFSQIKKDPPRNEYIDMTGVKPASTPSAEEVVDAIVSAAEETDSTLTVNTLNL